MKTQFNFQIEPNVQKRLKALAAKRGQAIGDTIAFMVDIAESLDQLDGKIKNEIRQAAEGVDYPEGAIWANLAIHGLGDQLAESKVRESPELYLDEMITWEESFDGTKYPITGMQIFLNTTSEKRKLYEFVKACEGKN